MIWLLIVAFLGLSNSLADKSNDGCPDVEVVRNFNLYRYLGKWYEQAKYPNPFEKEGKCISAEYSLNENGSVHVLNSMINNRTNEESSIEGSARLNSQTGEAKILVYFKVAVAEAPYWVLATDYSNYSVVWNCWNPLKLGVRKTAWILTRDRNPSDNLLINAMDILKQQKIDTDMLVKTDQENCDSD